jgi:hypothetical protein
MAAPIQAQRRCARPREGRSPPLAAPCVCGCGSGLRWRRRWGSGGAPARELELHRIGWCRPERDRRHYPSCALHGAGP